METVMGFNGIEMSKLRTIILDPGHGGLIDGIPQTKGKRSPEWPDGSILYEGEFNRAVVAGISEQLSLLGIPFIVLVPELEDINLHTRIERANALPRKKYYLQSIHCDAFDPSPDANGWSIYTSKGETKSDKFATIVADEFTKEYPTKTFRTDYSDGDPDKEENFYMLRKTRMPAGLSENFFMTNPEDCQEQLLTKEGRRRIISLHVEAFKRITLL